MAPDSDRMDLHADDVLFGQENDVFGFESSTMSNVNLGVSFSETLIGADSSMGLFSGTDVFGFHMNSGCNVTLNCGEKEGFYQEKFNGLANGGMLGVVDGGCDGKVGKFSHGLVQNEDETTVIQSPGGGCAESDKDLVFGLNNGVQIDQGCQDATKLAEVSLDMEDLFSRKSFLSDAQVNEIQNYIQHNCCGLDLVVDLNSYKSTREDNDNVPRDSMFSDVNYCISDLVWGKVSGHPWWPGQIYDPSIASETAKSYWEEDCYLIAYFGGQKFAWNEVSTIKPFHKYFSEMAKQTDCESFRFAVDCALEEASRRVAVGLSCPCLPEPEEVSNLKTQVVADAEICNQSFEPAGLLNFVQSLAQSPLTEFDRLDLVRAHGQVSAFYRSKGYLQLPEFAVHDRLFVPDMETLPVREEEQCFLPDLISEKNPWTPNDECTLEKKTGNGFTSRRGRKRKASHDPSYDCFQNFQNEDDKSTPRKRGRKPKVAYNISDDCFQNSQISVNNSTPRKRGRKPKAAYNTSDDCFQNSQVSVNNSTPCKRGRKPKLACNTYDNCFNNSQTGNSTEFENGSVHDMWSQLCLAAKDPAGESCYTEMIDYFADFRKVTGRNNSAFLEQGFSLEQKHDGDTGEDSVMDLASTEAAAEASVMDLGVIASTEAAAEASVMDLGVIASIEAAAEASVMDLGVIASIEAAAEASVSTPELGVITSIEAATASISTTPIELSPTIDLLQDGNLISESFNHVEQNLISEPFNHVEQNLISEPFNHVEQNLISEPFNHVEQNLISEPFNHVEQNLRAEPSNHVEHTSTSEEETQEETLSNKQNLPASKISFNTGLIYPNTDENLASEPSNQVEHASENSPTAFTLKFTNFDSIPSEKDLNQIFGRYGPLIESKTELLERTKCVRVVFKRRIDAESAFSSAGKYSIFGPSLKSYRLKILPPMPEKAPGKKRGRKSKKEIASMKAAAV